MNLKCMCPLLLGLFVSSPTFALIDMIPKVIEVKDDATTVVIVNEGDAAEYVAINLSRLLNPGDYSMDEKLEPVALVAQPALYAYPFRLMLAPGQSKKVTLKPLKSVDSEAVYRLDVKPVVNVLDPQQKALEGHVVLKLGFSGLVRQLPMKQNSELSVKCEADGARLFASGNTRYSVSDATVDGVVKEPFNVYPGVPLLLKGMVINIPEQNKCAGLG